MSGTIGPLLPSDEGFNHQIVDTFATVSQSDYSWTEKVCGMAAARDGSLQVGFGFGKYINRNVVDGYGGVSRGVEQWTVRASRALIGNPESVSVGPILYEVVEPLHAVRVRLEPNGVQPIAFDILCEGVVPCVLEEREDNANCADPTTVARINQFRDCLIRVRDGATGAIGWGNCQTFVLGAWPEFGLPAAVA